MVDAAFSVISDDLMVGGMYEIRAGTINGNELDLFLICLLDGRIGNRREVFNEAD